MNSKQLRITIVLLVLVLVEVSGAACSGGKEPSHPPYRLRAPGQAKAHPGARFTISNL